MIDLSESKVYEFEEFRLDAKSHRLFRRETGTLVPLAPKAVELLLVLIENKRRILSKDELLDTVWGNSFVEESNLSQTIFVLRKALGENTKEPRFILTAPNRGYQFIAPVLETGTGNEILEESFLSDTRTSKIPDSKFQIPDSNPKSKIRNPKLIWLAVPLVLILAFGVYRFYPAAHPATVGDVKSIAVLPFTNIGGKADEEYLGQGLSEVLVSKLINIKTIVVRPTRSVMKFTDESPDLKKIGGDLDVEAIVTGRVQKIDERIRVTVQMVRVSDGATLWAGTFDDQFTNIFAVQDSISRQVSESLAVKLTTDEREQIAKRYTTNSEAFRLYLQGRYLWNKRTPENLLKAVEQFEQAKQLDSNFALAYVGLADCYVLLAEYRVMPPRESFPKARAAVAAALEIDNKLVEARTSLAYILAFYEWDFPAAEREFKKAIEQNPNNATAHQWYAEYLQTVGRFDESLTKLRRAEELDPLSLIIKTDVARYFYFTRQYDRAIEQSNKIIAIDPNFGWGYSFLWLSYREKGLLQEASDAHLKAHLLFGGNQAEIEARRQAFAQNGWQGYWLKFLEQSETPANRPFIQAFDKAAVYQEIGDKEQAIASLQQSFERREHWLLYIKHAPHFDNLHSDPRFQDLLQRMKL